MKTFLHVASLSGGALLCSLAIAQSEPGMQPMGRSEAMQMSQDMSPQARAQLSRREAHAAYNEAMKACKTMAQSERKDCMAEAKTNLNQDLRYAREMRKPGAGSMGMGQGGMSGGDGRGMSGSDRMSGMNDMSGAGSSSSGASGGGSQRSSMREGAMQGGQPPSSMSAEPVTAAEKQQLIQSFTPQARYNLAKREANAAHAEALKECKALSGAERSSCTKDARATLQQDLAYAKRQMQEDSAGASGAGSTDSGMSGPGGR